MGEWYFYQVAVQEEQGYGNVVVTDHFVVAARTLEEATKTASEVERWFVWVNPDGWRVPDAVAAKHAPNWPAEVPASVMEELGDAVAEIPQRAFGTSILDVRGRVFEIKRLRLRLAPGCIVRAAVLVLAVLCTAAAGVWFWFFRSE